MIICTFTILSLWCILSHVNVKRLNKRLHCSTTHIYCDIFLNAYMTYFLYFLKNDSGGRIK